MCSFLVKLFFRLKVFVEMSSAREVMEIASANDKVWIPVGNQLSPLRDALDVELKKACKRSTIHWWHHVEQARNAGVRAQVKTVFLECVQQLCVKELRLALESLDMGLDLEFLEKINQ